MYHKKVPFCSVFLKLILTYLAFKPFDSAEFPLSIGARLFRFVELNGLSTSKTYWNISMHLCANSEFHSRSTCVTSVFIRFIRFVILRSSLPWEQSFAASFIGVVGIFTPKAVTSFSRQFRSFLLDC